MSYYASGNCYQGSYKNGRRNGFGNYYYFKTGDTYRGNYNDDKKNGVAAYFSG